MKYLILSALIIFYGCKENPPITTAPEKPIETTPLNLNASFDYPWKKDTSLIVIDAYQGNGIDWDKMATDKKNVAVIHRSSSGLRTDSKYIERKKEALKRGYLWGAYHLGERGNTLQQADLFISLANDNDTLMVLDLEDTANKKMMSVDESVLFMDYVFKKTGKLPVVYANHSVTVALNSKLKNDAMFKNSRLWYARFKGKVTDFPVGIWKNYFLWQFSSEINCTKTGSCLYNVPGTLFDMDVNVFYGSKEELKSQWRN